MLYICNFYAMIRKKRAGEDDNMKRLLEAFFMIVMWFVLMKAVDIALCQFVNEIAVQNILAVVAAFVSLILSVWLSERIVRMIRKYL